jgi:hypothetical protein
LELAQRKNPLEIGMNETSQQRIQFMYFGINQNAFTLEEPLTERAVQHRILRNTGFDERREWTFLASIEREMSQSMNAYLRTDGILPIQK